MKARLLKGTILYERKEFELAIYELKQAYKLDEKEVQHQLVKAMLDYGDLLEMKGQIGDAEKIYDEIIQDIYENEETALERKAKILIKRGDDFLSEGKPILAFQAYVSAKANKKIVKLLEMVSTQALVLEKDEKWAEAENIYSTLASMQPDEEKWQLKRVGIRKFQDLLNKVNKLIETATDSYEIGNFTVSRQNLDSANTLLHSVELSDSNTVPRSGKKN